MLATCHRFELELERDIAEVVERFDGGVAVLNTRLPLIWSANYLLLDAGARPEPARIERLVDEHLDARGMRHGAVETVAAGNGEPLAAALAERGWDRDQTLYKVARRPPDRGPSADAEEIPRDALAPLRREVAEELERGAGVADQMLERDRLLDSVAGGRWFAAMHEGVPGSCCVLLSRGGVGQIETVITAPRARNRGLARAVLLAALEASGSAGNDLTFLGADADDWPERLYARLGFDPVGVATAMIRKPSGYPADDILPA
ncbi:MAG TPA: GNAT family N-acetyltransferase [Solirubrobacterales bacterium]|jgi:ribosomal protein S18 acetylase RimI-like enzyme|nr:GNAT family N-acetyltransferase [Solirubrobacterales bacterium]